MQENKSLRETQIQMLEDTASGKGLCGDVSGHVEKSKRILSYVSRAPKNLAELQVHQIFLKLCQHEDTSARRMLDFWTEVLNNELMAHCLAGTLPQDTSELTEYKLLVLFSRDFSSESSGFVNHLKEHFWPTVQEFIFRAKKIDYNPTLEAIFEKTRNNAKGIWTFLALAASKDNLVFYHHPAISTEEASSSLRDLRGWWLSV